MSLADIKTLELSPDQEEELSAQVRAVAEALMTKDRIPAGWCPLDYLTTDAIEGIQFLRRLEQRIVTHVKNPLVRQSLCSLINGVICAIESYNEYNSASCLSQHASVLLYESEIPSDRDCLNKALHTNSDIPGKNSTPPLKKIGDVFRRASQPFGNNADANIFLCQFINTILDTCGCDLRMRHQRCHEKKYFEKISNTHCCRLLEMLFDMLVGDQRGDSVAGRGKESPTGAQNTTQDCAPLLNPELYDKLIKTLSAEKYNVPLSFIRNKLAYGDFIAQCMELPDLLRTLNGMPEQVITAVSNINQAVVNFFRVWHLDSETRKNKWHQLRELINTSQFNEPGYYKDDPDQKVSDRDMCKIYTALCNGSLQLVEGKDTTTACQDGCYKISLPSTRELEYGLLKTQQDKFRTLFNALLSFLREDKVVFTERDFAKCMYYEKGVISFYYHKLVFMTVAHPCDEVLTRQPSGDDALEELVTNLHNAINAKFNGLDAATRRHDVHLIPLHLMTWSKASIERCVIPLIDALKNASNTPVSKAYASNCNVLRFLLELLSCDESLIKKKFSDGFPALDLNDNVFEQMHRQAAKVAKHISKLPSASNEDISDGDNDANITKEAKHAVFDCLLDFLDHGLQAVPALSTMRFPRPTKAQAFMSMTMDQVMAVNCSALVHYGMICAHKGAGGEVKMSAPGGSKSNRLSKLTASALTDEELMQTLEAQSGKVPKNGKEVDEMLMLWKLLYERRGYRRAKRDPNPQLSASFTAIQKVTHGTPLLKQLEKKWGSNGDRLPQLKKKVTLLSTFKTYVLKHVLEPGSHLCDPNITRLWKHVPDNVKKSKELKANLANGKIPNWAELVPDLRTCLAKCNGPKTILISDDDDTDDDNNAIEQQVPAEKPVQPVPTKEPQEITLVKTSDTKQGALTQAPVCAAHNGISPINIDPVWPNAWVVEQGTAPTFAFAGLQDKQAEHQTGDDFKLAQQAQQSHAEEPEPKRPKCVPPVSAQDTNAEERQEPSAKRLKAEQPSCITDVPEPGTKLVFFGSKAKLEEYPQLKPFNGQLVTFLEARIRNGKQLYKVQTDTHQKCEFTASALFALEHRSTISDALCNAILADRCLNEHKNLSDVLRTLNGDTYKFAESLVGDLLHLLPQMCVQIHDILESNAVPNAD